MHVLVDYDNIADHIRSQGPLNVADRLFEVLRPYLFGETHLNLKLYGGWYQEATLTRKAQDLVAQLQTFPYPMWIKENVPARLVRITADLAHSLEVLPKKLLHSTYRERPPARRFSCEDPQQRGCSATPCPLSSVAAFVNNRRCPEASCPVVPKALFRGVGEQKMVDTMLSADLIHLCQIGASKIAIVTSDDDVWPAIISALVKGTHVLHIHSGSPSSSTDYRAGVPGKYTELSL